MSSFLSMDVWRELVMMLQNRLPCFTVIPCKIVMYGNKTFWTSVHQMILLYQLCHKAKITSSPRAVPWCLTHHCSIPYSTAPNREMRGHDWQQIHSRPGISRPPGFRRTKENVHWIQFGTNTQIKYPYWFSPKMHLSKSRKRQGS